MVSGDTGEVFSIGGPQVGPGVSLEISPEHCHGIKFRGIGREEARIDSLGSSRESGGTLGSLRQGAVPNDDKRLLRIPQPMEGRSLPI